MRLLILSLFFSATLAWTFAQTTCRNLFPGLRIFDFFCGHNVFLQVTLLFSVLFALFLMLGHVLMKQGRVHKNRLL